MTNLNGDDFKGKGPQFEEAWRILQQGCKYPASLEVFEEELKAHREGCTRRRITANPNLTPAGMARRLVEGYHLTTMSFPEDVE